MWRHLLNGLLYILALCQLYRIWLYTGLALCKSIHSPAIHRASPVYSRWTYTFAQGQYIPHLTIHRASPVYSLVLFNFGILFIKPKQPSLGSLSSVVLRNFTGRSSFVAPVSVLWLSLTHNSVVYSDQTSFTLRTLIFPATPQCCPATIFAFCLKQAGTLGQHCWL